MRIVKRKFPSDAIIMTTLSGEHRKTFAYTPFLVFLALGFGLDFAC
jgi:hypothetical protein